MQLTDTIGAIKLAERVPDMYVMAPQAPAGGLSMEEMFAKMCSKGDPHKVIIGAESDNWFEADWYDTPEEVESNGAESARSVYSVEHITITRN